MDSALAIDNVFRASSLLEPSSSDAKPLELSRFQGQISELSAERGQAYINLVFDLIVEAQSRREPVAWIGDRPSIFYGPDARHRTIDWQAVALISLVSARDRARAADQLLRSGAFGLVIIDLAGATAPHIGDPLMHRLAQWSRRHTTATLFINDVTAESKALSPLLQRRVCARWSDVDAERLIATYTITKDKRQAPGAQIEEVYHGPMGLR